MKARTACRGDAGASPPLSEGMGARALYLAEADGLVVRADGPSLRIEQPGKAAWHVPPGRVGRAVFWGNVLVESAAIGLLLAGGVPVSFVGRRGETMGLAWAPTETLGPLAGLLDRRRRDPEWVEAYRLLLDAQVRQARLELVRRISPAVHLRWTESGFRGADWDAWRTTVLTGDLRVDPPWRYLKSLVWEAVTALVRRLGLDAHRGLLDPRQPLGLVHELARPLAPWIDGAVHWGLRAGLVRRGAGGDESAAALTPAAVRRWTARFEGELPWLERDITRRIDEVLDLARDWQPPPGRTRRRRGEG
ncbi:MAG: CRISPR-associated endonuclease Cas1 [Thermodesulfobacteriota bacterium]